MNDNVISNNLEIARRKIDDSRNTSGVEDVVIVGITKTRTALEVVDLIEAGCSTIGENRVQEWENKYPLVLDEMKARGINSGFTSHLVGHLQSNKAKRAVEDFDFIQSLDSVKLAQRISRIIEENDREPLQCLIQVKLGEEETKSGIGKAELLRDFEQFIGLKSIRISGLMLIAPLWAMGEEARPYYNEMHELFQSLKKQEDSRFEMKYLSMGMSADFDVAVEEGANMVRIGRALFEGFDSL
jgi:pyridoxal phosphate enzyme (YggS family)